MKPLSLKIKGRGFILLTKNVEIREIANVTFSVLEKCGSKKNTAIPTTKMRQMSKKYFQQKHQKSAKVCLQNVCCGLSLSLSGKCNDPYRRPGDSVCIRKTPR